LWGLISSHNRHIHTKDPYTHTHVHKYARAHMQARSDAHTYGHIRNTLGTH